MAESTINVVYPDMSRQSFNVNINTTTVASLMAMVNKNGKKYNLFCSYDNGVFNYPLSDDDDDVLLASTCLTESAGAPRAGGTTYTIYAKSLDAGYMMQGTRSYGGRRRSRKSKKSRKSRKSRRSKKSRKSRR